MIRRHKISDLQNLKSVTSTRLDANRLREEVEDLLDCLDALETRAESVGKKHLTLSQARERLKLAPH